MKVELSRINWDALDENDLSVLPREFSLDIVFSNAREDSIVSKGFTLSYELMRRVEHLARFPIYPRDFFWKSSKSDRMHRWSWDMRLSFGGHKFAAMHALALR